jgi:recombination DNA repair RAD52 pathway protein
MFRNKGDGAMTRVSDHAIVRYLERVKGLDIEAIKKEILPDALSRAAKKMGNGFYPVNGTHKVRIKNQVVITVLNPKMKIKKNDLTRNMTTRNKSITKRDRVNMKRAAQAATEYEQYEEAGFL